ncbi:MAG: formate/nitrite transporter family protein [Alphaproteobacteria bacterium]
MFELDAYSPAQIAERVETIGVAKTRLGTRQTLMLAVLAGAFIALGALFYTVTVTGSTFGFGPTRLLGGLAFSLGLLLVIVGGAELFTGNNLIVMAWADERVSLAALLRNWTLVYVGNLVGALGIAGLVAAAGVMELGGGGVAKTAIAIAHGKLGLGFVEAFARGVLCNLLVCLACWVSFAAHDVAGKVLALMLPVAAFVALGFEHSVANMYILPVAWLAGGTEVTLAGVVANLVPVTLGNIVGGGALVAGVYWLVYGKR